MADIPREAFRAVLFEALATTDSHMWPVLVENVASVGARLGFVPNPERSNQPPKLSPADEARLRSLFWQLVAQGVMTVGSNQSNPAWPFLSVTEFGKEVLESHGDRGLLPYDHLGYIAEMRVRDPDVSDLVLQAVGEAAECFSTGTLRAATVMLGVASEASMRELINVFASSISDEGKRTKFTQDTSRNMSRSFEALRKRLESMKGDMPGDVQESLGTLFGGVFETIRLSRNDAGHPRTVTEIEPSAVHARLILFLVHTSSVAQLKKWLADRTGQVV